MYYLISRATLGLVLLFAAAAPASAGVIFNAEQVGDDVVITGAGTLDLSGSIFSAPNWPTATNSIAAALDPSDFGTMSVTVGLTPEFVELHIYSNSIAGPSVFGSGGFASASSGTGDFFGLTLTAPHIVIVPNGYTSGDSLSGTATWDNQSFASLGMTPGTYTWTFDTAGGTDFFTLNVPVPEPTSMTCFLSLAGLCMLRRRR